MEMGQPNNFSNRYQYLKHGLVGHLNDLRQSLNLTPNRLANTPPPYQPSQNQYPPEKSVEQEAQEEILKEQIKEEQKDTEAEAQREVEKELLKEKIKDATKDPAPEAHSELVKEQLKEDEKNQQKLDGLLQKTNNVLLKIKTHLPLDIFPDEIIIDINKVNIISNLFFKSKDIHSIMITDISDVIVTTSLLFAQLQIIDKGYTENSRFVRYLKKKEAFQARDIIQGLMVAHHKEIDLSKMADYDLANKIAELGKIKS